MQTTIDEIKAIPASITEVEIYISAWTNENFIKVLPAHITRVDIYQIGVHYYKAKAVIMALPSHIMTVGIGSNVNLGTIKALPIHILEVALIDPSVSEAMVKALPTNVTRIIIYPSIDEVIIKALPAHIKLVGISPGVSEATIKALPSHILMVDVYAGVSEAVIKALPPHITKIGINSDLDEAVVKALSAHILVAHLYLGVTLAVIKALPGSLSAIAIFGRIDKAIVEAIPSHIKTVGIGSGVDAAAIKALPTHVKKVGILPGASQSTVKALPAFVTKIVSISPGVSDDVVNALPNHILEVVIISGMTEATVKALPEHITLVDLSYGVSKTLVKSLPSHVFVVQISKETSELAIRAIPEHILIVLTTPETPSNLISAIPDHVFITAEVLPDINNHPKPLPQQIIGKNLLAENFNNKNNLNPKVWKTLEKIGSFAFHVTLPIIELLLNNDDRNIRLQVLTTIGNVLENGNACINVKLILPCVDKGLQDRDCWVRQEAINTLVKLATIDPHITIARFQIIFSDNDKAIRDYGLVKLKDIISYSPDNFIPLAKLLLNDENSEIKKKAQLVLDENVSYFPCDPPAKKIKGEGEDEHSEKKSKEEVNIVVEKPLPENLIPLVKLLLNNENSEIKKKAQLVLDENVNCFPCGPPAKRIKGEGEDEHSEKESKEEVDVVVEKPFQPKSKISAINWNSVAFFKPKNNPVTNSKFSTKKATKRKFPSPKKSKFSEQAKIDIGKWGEEAVYKKLLNHYETKYNVKGNYQVSSFTLQGYKANNPIEIEVIWHNAIQESGQSQDLSIFKVTKNSEHSEIAHKERVVEVKSTTSKTQNKAKFSSKQLALMQQFKENYWLFSVFSTGSDEVSIHKFKNPYPDIIGNSESELPISSVKVFIKK